MHLFRSIWQNKKNILAGITSRVTASKEVAQIAEERTAICDACPFHSTQAKLNGYTTRRPDEHCTKCGCNIFLKTACLHCNCPLDPPRWIALTTAAESDQISNLLNDNPSNSPS